MTRAALVLAILLSSGCGDAASPDGGAALDGGGRYSDAAASPDAATGSDAGPPGDAAVDAGSDDDAGTLEPAPGTWGVRADMIDPRSEMAVAQLDGLIYVIGGYASDRVAVATAQRYDPAADAWERIAPLPRPIDHSVAVGAAGRVFVLGGQETGHGGAFVNEVYAYDPSADTWTARANMPIARGGGAGARIGDQIYVAGGRPPHGAAFARYDVAADEWTSLPDIPTQRNHLAVEALDGMIRVVGGREGAGFRSLTLDVVEVFDPVSSAWTTGAPLLRPRGGLNSAVVNGCLHTFGGEGSLEDRGGVFPDHDVFDPGAGGWTGLAPMPTPIHGVTGAAVIDGLVYLPGGGTEEGGSSGGVLVQVYRPALDCR